MKVLPTATVQCVMCNGACLYVFVYANDRLISGSVLHKRFGDISLHFVIQSAYLAVICHLRYVVAVVGR